MLMESLIQSLRRLGLSVEPAPEPHPSSFLDGVWMDQGTLFVHQSAIPGRVLHEAGHLATVPRRLHPFLHPGDYVSQAMKAAIEVCLALDCYPDHPLIRAIIQMSDPEATAWSYAAAVEIGFDVEQIFTYPGVPASEQPYEGDGADILMAVRMGRYCGINGLQAAGFCRVREWPKMRKWVQDA